MANDSALTTIDNPFDPFTQFDDWYQFDEEHGYHTCSLLARLAYTSNDLSDKDNEEEIERAMDEIVRLNVSGVHKKVTATTVQDDTPSETT
jgi:hypothetical protein